MHLHLCIGFLESRDGPLLGLREFVSSQLLPRYPSLSVSYNSWRDPLTSSIPQHYKPNSPLILLGHSYGASALFRAACKLPHIPVDHFIMLDPVPRWGWGQFQWSCYKLPKNISAATCLYNPISLPKSSPIRNTHSNKNFRNISVFALHASIPSDSEVQAHLLQIITATLASRPQSAPPILQPAQKKEVRIPPVIRAGL